MEKKNNTDFSRALKNWRKEKNLTQKALAEMLGVDASLISHYVCGRALPSPETAERLIELGFPREFIQCGQHYIRTQKDELSDEERLFAEKHHKTVSRFLRFYRLNADEWYDVVIFGYLHAVQKWFRREAVRKYAFSTIAFKSMKNSVSNEYRKRSVRIQTVSLDEIIPETDGLTYADMLCDPRDCVGI